MAKSSLSITLVILFCGLTLASRTKILPLSTITALAPELNDGWCDMVVATTYNQSLAFLLADNGFDVWIANTRGTKYSHGHASFSNNSSDYWNWSWDELVAYDLPATFQYVHDQTGQKLHYGTLVALAAFSKDQQLDKLRSAALLCPIAYVGQMTSPLTKDAADHFIAESLYKLGIFEFSLKG
ncbi:triacylglycerol lipase 2 [Medicago truncatula]|uniref:triacylglycerol lipase 2 n=1 Tax=Medicago truncatula TaxID=3880 RepID=UPI000D2F2DA7|nr:triacylglycerol lipase 2 [Medicago truncatula]